jgi:hypothetical protein
MLLASVEIEGATKGGKYWAIVGEQETHLQTVQLL